MMSLRPEDIEAPTIPIGIDHAWRRNNKHSADLRTTTNINPALLNQNQRSNFYWKNTTTILADLMTVASA
ncbi:hypothetical protein ACHAXN_001630 [Cyclotella atomus]